MAGYLKKIGKNYFNIYVEDGKDPKTGKRHRICRTFRGNGSEARLELARLETEIAQGMFLAPSKDSLGQYLKWWLEQHASSKPLAPMTRQSYNFLIEHFLIPSLGAVKLTDLNAVQIQSMITETRKNVSPRTVNYCLVVLRLALKHAVKRYKLIRENPAESLEVSSKTAKKQHVLLPEDMKKILAKTSARDYNIAAFALFTGMRRGEILGLRWEDIQDDRLKVNQTLQRIIGEGLIFKPPKTEAGQRWIALPATIVALLGEIHRGQAKHKLKLGADYAKHNLVFCLPDGNPLDPDGVTRRFHTAAAEAGYNIRFHDMRHMFASWMLADGEMLQVVQNILGHEQPSTTQDTYGEALPNMQKEAVGRYDKKYGNIISADNGQI